MVNTSSRDNEDEDVQKLPEDSDSVIFPGLKGASDDPYGDQSGNDDVTDTEFFGASIVDDDSPLSRDIISSEPEEFNLDDGATSPVLGDDDEPEWGESFSDQEQIIVHDPYDTSDSVADYDEDDPNDFLPVYDPSDVEDTPPVVDDEEETKKSWLNAGVIISSIAAVSVVAVLGALFLAPGSDENNSADNGTSLTITTDETTADQTVLDNDSTDLLPPSIDGDDRDQDGSTSEGTPDDRPDTAPAAPAAPAEDNRRVEQLERELAEANRRADAAERDANGGRAPVVRTTTVTSRDEDTITRTVPGEERTVTRTVPGAERTVTRTEPGPERVVTSEVPGPTRTVTTTAPGARVTVTTTIIERLR